MPEGHVKIQSTPSTQLSSLFMSKRRIDNSLYEYIRGAISNALPLEYTIRASETLYPEQTNQLKKINQDIVSYWDSKGFSDSEIRNERLLDYSWDAIQLGFPLVRRHSTQYGAELLAALQECFDELPMIFESAYNSIRLPTSKYFRICDLLNGNHIETLFSKTMLCLEKAEQYKKSDEIEADFLPSINIREPIRIHPAMTYIRSAIEPDRFGVTFDLKADISTADFIRQIQEYIYQFAVNRVATYNRDTLARHLIQAFLEKDFHGSGSENPVERFDGFASRLSGLYFWDIRNRDGVTEDEAFAKTSKIYVDKSEEAISKNYKTARRMIKAAMTRLQDS